MQPLTHRKVLNHVSDRKAYIDFITKDGFQSTRHNKKTLQHLLFSLAGLEDKLKRTSGKFCLGDTLTLADVCLVPQVSNAKRYFDAS